MISANLADHVVGMVKTEFKDELQVYTSAIDRTGPIFAKRIIFKNGDKIKPQQFVNDIINFIKQIESKLNFDIRNQDPNLEIIGMYVACNISVLKIKLQKDSCTE